MIELMNLDKYKDWSLQVKTELKRKQLWDIVEGTDEPPEAENDDPAFMAWSRKNAEALGVIKRGCKNEFYDAIRRISLAKIAWDTLAAISALPKTGFEFLADDGNNYLDWSLQVKAILTDRQLWHIVEGTDDAPKAEKNDMALGLIEYSCFWSGLSDKLRSITSAKIVWDALAAICALPKNLNMITLMNVDQYEDWSLQVKTELRHRQLWDIVEGTDEPPEAENDDPAFMAWSRKNKEALGVIKRDCKNEFYDAIRRISSAKIVWDTLAGICALPKSFIAGLKFLEYLDWSLQLKAILTDRQLWDIVEGTNEPPNAENDEAAFKAWSVKNDVALGLIEYSLFWSELIPSEDLELIPSEDLELIPSEDSDLRDELWSIASAKIVWDALAAICALPKTAIERLDSIPAVIKRLTSNPAVIKRLDDVDNYEAWSLQVKTYLTDQQLWDIAEGTNEPPKADNDEAAFKAWSEKNALAYRVIVFSCGYRLRFAIWWITSAKIAWDTLTEICNFPESGYIVPGEYDYEAWSVRMEAYLKDCVLWDVVEAPEPEDDEIAYNAWSKKNAIALYLIWESSDAFFSFKRSTRTAQIAWDTLAEFGNPGELAPMELDELVEDVMNLDINIESMDDNRDHSQD